MRWEAWVLITLYAINTLGSIALIGRPRQPLNPSTAVASVVLGGFYAWLVLRLAGVA